MNLYSHMQTGEDIPKPFNTCNTQNISTKKNNFEDIIFLLFIFYILNSGAAR